MFAALAIHVTNIMDIVKMRQIVSAEEIDRYLLVLIALASVLIILAIFAPKVYKLIPKWISGAVTALTALLVSIVGIKKKDNTTPIKDDTLNNEDDLYKAIETAGYSYDSMQDIFYSNMDAWQRDMGYCRLYDEAAAPMGMIIDCEPIYFEYEGKRWLIEFWKGQYDLTMGCEIGVYTTEQADLNIPGIFKGPFFQCAKNEDHLYMDYYAVKNSKILFRRVGKHWWLTGFKLGEFSEPSDLRMYLTITLKDENMRDAFVGGLKNAGYSERELTISENKVGLKFNKTHTKQPITRIKETDRIIQIKNQILCEKYQEITGPYNSFPEKMKAIKEQSTELYQLILHIGKTKQLFASFEKIKDYLD